MIAPRPWFACLLAVLLLAPVCSAGDNGLSRVELGRRGKAATALVEIKNAAVYGSAFCIHSTGLFLTNEHVLRGPVMFPNNTPTPDSVTVVLNPGLNTERSYRADVVRKDAVQDLALLRIKGVSGLAALSLGDDDKLEELADVVAFGFPFGNAPLLRNRDYPEISVNAGSITSLRHKNGKLHRIQLDAALNPGNSGGPVLDKTGQVVGVVVATVNPGNGVHFAIPASIVKRFLVRPDVHFEAPEIRSIELYSPIRFEAQVVSILPTKKPFTVDLTLQTPRGRPTTYRMKPAGGRYQVTATPMTRPSTPLVVRVVA
ncbi:MAG TPA: serine protease, partial [Gemmataceae bacterium]|nr:serine protease [Gemmataceae bacterium]